MQETLVLYRGGCHCKKVQFECRAPETLTVWKCNCSICYIKQNHHFIIPQANFTLLGDSADHVTMYSFNTHQAKHYFCKVCGVQSYYYPRSNPDGIGINIYSIELPLNSKIELKGFDGQNWEQFFEKNREIQKFSQAPL